jgi:divalent metal cation (Fe/Co/Zn/Cd) transporter
MGSAPDKETLAKLVKCAKSVPGVLDTHGIEVHEYGAFKSVSMHIRVSESMGAGDAHGIARHVEECVQSEFGIRPLVHIDPVRRHCEGCELAMIGDIAKGFRGVISMHDASMHHTPEGTHVDMHVLVDGRETVESGHRLVHDIMEEVERRLPDHRVDIHLEPCKGNCPTCEEECERRGGQQ